MQWDTSIKMAWEQETTLQGLMLGYMCMESSRLKTNSEVRL